MSYRRPLLALAVLCPLFINCSDNGQGGLDASLPDLGGGDSSKTWPDVPGFRAGFAAVKITPKGLEGFVDWANNGEFDDAPHTSGGKSYPPDQFLDSGVDGKLDFQEAGAFGADNKPGKAGVDDDNDGTVDDILGCHPGDDTALAASKGCEYLAAGSDDKADPAGDNYHKTKSPKGTEQDGTWQKVVIAGYGGVLTGDPIRPAQGVHDDIWARAMVFSQGKNVLALVAVDMVGYMHLFGNVARRSIAAQTGIPVHNIIYMATHNHDAPDVIGIWAGPNDLDFDYIAQVNKAMEEAVVKAVGALTPARLKSATAQVHGCYDQKTLRFKQGKDCNFPVSFATLNKNPTQYDMPVNQIDLRDPMVYNHNVTAMQATDAKTSKVLGTVVNFHDHPEVLGDSNNMISSDYPHYVRQALEQQYGGTALFLSGTTGSQIGTLRGTRVPLYDSSGKMVPDKTGKKDADGKPFPQFAANDSGDPRKPPYDKIRSLGYVVADAVSAALAGAKETASPTVSVKSQDLDVPLNNPSLGLGMVMIEGMAKTKGYVKHPDDQLVEADYCPATTGRKACIRIQMTVATVGEVTLLTTPGEPSPEYLLGRKASQVDFGSPWGVFKYLAMPRLLDHVKTRDAMMLCIANGYLGYLVPEKEYLADEKHPNHYEEVGSAGSLFGDTVGNKLLQMLGAPSSVTFNAKIALHP